LLLSYNVVEDYVSLYFGLVLQINGKLGVATSDEDIIKGTLFKVDQTVDISTVSGNFYLLCSVGSRTVCAVIFYEYGFTNILNKLNKDVTLQPLNNGDNLKGNVGVITLRLIFTYKKFREIETFLFL
jgi:hypothetical protein